MVRIVRKWVLSNIERSSLLWYLSRWTAVFERNDLVIFRLSVNFLNEWKVERERESYSMWYLEWMLYWNHDWETNPEQRRATVESLEDSSLAMAALKARVRISWLAGARARLLQGYKMTRIVPLFTNTASSHTLTLNWKEIFSRKFNWDDIL